VSRRAAGLLLAVLLGLTGCGSSSTTEPLETPQSQPADPDVLPAGKGDLALKAMRYYSPVDFVPALSVAVPAGWHSTHRGDDAFDLSRPDPKADAPLVAVVLVTPPGDAVAASLAALRAKATVSVTDATGTLAGQPATGFDLVGGTGELLKSPTGTLSLDAAPGQRVRVLGIDVEDVPLLVAVVVPDGRRFAELLPQAQALLDGLTLG
jgi:hypothetical protein